MGEKHGEILLGALEEMRKVRVNQESTLLVLRWCQQFDCGRESETHDISKGHCIFGFHRPKDDLYILLKSRLRKHETKIQKSKNVLQNLKDMIHKKRNESIE